MMITKKGKKGKTEEMLENYNPKRDPIVKNLAMVLVPFNLMFGVYVVLNGHLSPGGGFSGGAIMGASLILFSSAYGYRKVRPILTEKLIRNVTFVSLTFYAVAKGYSFFTGANHLHSIISPGTPGRIMSAGIILPLNIAVGFVVTMTMYSFYALFTKEEI
jgi:multicomponent Na+:H+ antiporter subunit B